MHAGSISTTKTAAGKLYAYLRERPNQFFDGHYLTKLLDIVAISTRVSEVRAQLKSAQSSWEIEHKQVSRGHYYRVKLRDAAREQGAH